MSGDTIGPEDVIRLIAELQELNRTLKDVKSSTHVLCGNLKDMARHTKAVLALGKQVSVLNQILLQVGKSAGTAGMISSILQAVSQLSRRG